MLDYIEQTKNLTANEKDLFWSEMKNESKSVFTGNVMCLLLGATGAHRFYLNEHRVGLFYCFGFFIVVVFVIWRDSTDFYKLVSLCYTIGAFLEATMMSRRVLTYNLRLATSISRRIQTRKSDLPHS